jgi:hypothetical protein
MSYNTVIECRCGPKIGSDNASSHLLSCPLGRIADSADRSPLPDPPALPSLGFSLRAGQARLFCPCGETRLLCSGLCRRCYARQAHSRRCFAGHREAVLDRDRRCCACGAERKLAVHHRRPGLHQRRFLITLCAACHAGVHRLRAMRRWLEPALVPIWHEQHPGAPVQLQFEWSPAR